MSSASASNRSVFPLVNDTLTLILLSLSVAIATVEFAADAALLANSIRAAV